MAVGRGRGFLLSKMIDMSQKQTLMTPDQFKSEDDKAEKLSEPEDDFRFEDSPIEASPTVTSKQISQEIETASLPSKPKNNTIKKKDVSQEDIDWQVYKFGRKVKQILKEVTEENLADVYKTVKRFIEDRPLSSRFTGCSEAKDILEVIVQNSIADEQFLQFAPCFIKMIHELSEIEFNKHFPEILEEKKKDVIRVVASSEILLSQMASNYCTLLGRLFIMPRQKSTQFYEFICAIVEDTIEKWAYPESSQNHKFTGHNLSEKKVEASAAHRIIQTIASGMLECDIVVTEKMGMFTWQIKETVLNDVLPRELKELYLDALIEIQCTPFVRITPDGPLESEEEIEFETEEEEGETTVQTEIQENQADEEFQESQEEGNDEEVSEEDGGEDEDGYHTITFLLKHHDWDDLLQDFTDNNLKDNNVKELSKKDELLPALQKVGISTFLSRSITKEIKSRGWNFWESAASFESTEPNTLPPNRPRSVLSNRMAISFPKSGGSNNNDIHPQSSYAGVTQQKQKQTTAQPQLSALSHFADVSLSELDINRDFTTTTTEIKDHGAHQGQIFHQEDDDDDNDSSDLEFEDEEEEDDEQHSFSKHQGDEKEEVESSQEEENNEIESNQVEDREKKLYVPTATTSSSKPFKIVPNTENKASSFTMGRGRGMVKFGSSSTIAPGAKHSKVDSSSRHRNLPVAKVMPTERSFGTVDDFNAMFDGQNQQNRSSNWRNRDGGESNNDRAGTVSSASMNEENQEQLNWRNSRQLNNNNNTYSSQANNNQQYRSTGESNRTHQGNNTNRKYQDRSSCNGSPNTGSPNNFSNNNKGHHNHQKRGKKSWRNLDLNSTTQPNGGQYNTGNPPKIISGPPTINKNHPGRFQASHRSKAAVAISRPKVQRNNNMVVASENESGSDSSGFGFGTTKPDMCFRCSSVDHITEECTANNFFF